MSAFDRFPWEGSWTIVQDAALRYGVAPELILGVIAQESQFNALAYRAEPQINDASRGMMQLLLGTARNLGFSGDPSQLFDPAINIDLGTRLLAQNLTARGGDVSAALSQYNGGYRPPYGFGARLASGVFGNQPYVDAVLGYVADAQALVQSTDSVPPPDQLPDVGGNVGAGGTLLLLTGLGILALLALGRPR